jgi:orotate phosphoribosyltransferase
MTMTQDDVLAEFKACGAMLEGHFVLSSGLHSPVFLQKNKVFMHADRTERLCKALAAKIRAAVDGPIDMVVSPAVGAIIPGYEVARHLGVPSIYAEREGGAFKIRRGFEIGAGQRVVMVEDIVTTGLSSRECLDCIRATGAEIALGACIIDRSGGKAEIGVPLVSLAQLDIPAFPADALPADLAAVPMTDPGSRRLKA